MNEEFNNVNPVNQWLGLNKDAPEYINKQPTFILNGVLEIGEQGVLSSEQSNIECIVLEPNQKIIGNIYIGDGKTVLFTTDNTVSYIKVIKDCKIEESFLVSVLNFKVTHLIQGTYKIVNGCETIIYWNDNHLNPDRQFNLDKPNDYKTNNIFDSNKFNLIPDVLIPQVSISKVNNEEGSLESGQYLFFIEILDNMLNVVKKSEISNPVNIYYDNSEQSPDKIFGSFNYPKYSAEIGGKIKTSKSIDIDLLNVDTSFDYIRLNVIAYTNGDSVTAQTFKINTLYSITTKSIKFRGISTNDIIIDNNYAYLNNIIYNSSTYMEQVNNRLIRANLKTKNNDYSTFQSFANSIQTSAIWKKVKHASITEESAKNALFLEKYGFYMPDEIYSFGVVYVFKDGSKSPVFHIPGRQISSIDTQLITITTNNIEKYEFYPNIAIGQQIERWKLENTSQAEVSFNSDLETMDMSYWEDSTFKYPQTKDCNNNYIFGNLQNTPIRHHKFPNRNTTSRPFYIPSSNEMWGMGIQFENVIYPNNNIIGHFFVSAKRTDENKTVIDSARFNSVYDDSVSIGTSLLSMETGTQLGTDIKYLEVFSPKQTFKESLSFDYCAIEWFSNSSGGASNIQVNNVPTLLISTFAQAPTIVAPRFSRKKILKYANISSKSKLSSGLFAGTVENKDLINSHLLIELTNSLINTAPQGGSIFPPDNDFGYLKRYKTSLYSDLSNLEYKKISNIYYTNASNYKVFGGDCCITSLNVPYAAGDYNGLTVERKYHYYFDTEINTSLNIIGSDDCHTSMLLYDDMDKFFTAVLFNQNVTPSTFKEIFCDNYFKLNLDYKNNNKQLYYPLNFSYDYCSECLNNYPHRIIYSEPSFTEAKQDSFRITKANNYIDIPQNKGIITALKLKNNLLLTHTNDTTYIIKPNPQTLQTNNSTLYLGTGDFLSIPPEEFITTDTGFAGCQNKFATINTPHGYFWADAKQGQVFKFDQQIKPITNENMYHWFYDNLPFTFQKENPSFLETPYNSFNLKLSYDPYYKRILLVKKDYSYLLDSIFGNLIQDINGNISDPETGIADITDNYLFENKSWTLSYNLEHDKWVSFHSYIPEFSFNNEFNYFTNNQNKLYVHSDKTNSRRFYNTTYPFIVETVLSSYFTQELNSIDYISETLTYDNNKKTWVQTPDKTFDKLWIYSKDKSTGLLSLNYLNQTTNPFGNIEYSQNIKNIIRTDKNYKISQLYNLSTTTPVKSSSWDDIYSSYYIDAIPTTIASLNQINLDKLKDKYLFVRLYYTNSQNNNKLKLYFTNFNTNKSQR